jgi:hypothetical protein
MFLNQIVGRGVTALLLLALSVGGPSAWAQRKTQAPVPAANQLQASKQPQQQQRRVALVIGNGAYVSLQHLPNPANDARLIGDTLKSLGFTLVGGGVQIDLDKPAFDRAVQQLGQALQDADVGLFYYAGHGLQVQGTNWLVPIGANPTSQGDLDFQMIDANLVLRQMQFAHTALNVMILDACRNNPFGNRGLRAAQGGLAEMKAPVGTLIAYATQPGNVAQDGDGADSPFSTAVARTMRQPGLDVFRLFNQVGLDVQRETGGEQQPWMSSSPISGEFYFSGVGPNGVALAPLADPDVVFWQSITGSANPADYAAYLQQFPNGRFAALARQRVAVASAITTPSRQDAPPNAPSPAGLSSAGSLFSLLTPRPARSHGPTLFAASTEALNLVSSFGLGSYRTYTRDVDPARGPSGKETFVDIGPVANSLTSPALDRLERVLAQNQTNDQLGAQYLEIDEPGSLPTMTAAREAGVQGPEALVPLARRYAEASRRLIAVIAPARLYYDQKDFQDDRFAKGRAMHPALMAAFREFIEAGEALRGAIRALGPAARDAYLATLPPERRAVHATLLRTLAQARGLIQFVDTSLGGTSDMRRIDSARLRTQVDLTQQALGDLQALSARDNMVGERVYGAAKGNNLLQYTHDFEDFLALAKTLLRTVRDGKPPFGAQISVNTGGADDLVYRFNNLVHTVNFLADIDPED